MSGPSIDTKRFSLRVDYVTHIATVRDRERGKYAKFVEPSDLPSDAVLSAMSESDFDSMLEGLIYG